MNKKLLKKIGSFLIIVIGSVAVAFGNIVFLKPLEINAGGLNGIGIIIAHFAPEATSNTVYDISIAILSVVLWFVGFFFVSKDFAFKTIISTIAFPIASALFNSVPGACDFANFISSNLINYSGAIPSVGTYILFSMAGGVFVGFGVGITFMGGGSTGGVDALTFVMDKYLNIKQSVASFILDASVIIAGLIALCMDDPGKYLLSGLVGILSVAVSAFLIELVYIKFQEVYQCDIISDKWEEISRFVQDVLGKGVTVIAVKGGYKLRDRTMLRAIVNKSQYEELRKFIAVTDPKAFSSVGQTKMVYGEGFRPNRKPKKDGTKGV